MVQTEYNSVGTGRNLQEFLDLEVSETCKEDLRYVHVELNILIYSKASKCAELGDMYTVFNWFQKNLR